MAQRFATFMLVAFAVGSPALGAKPIGWRHDTSGNFPGSLPPAEWSAEEHILWKTRLPAGSNASPVIVGDRVYICAEPARLTCLSADDGSKIWEQDHTYEKHVSPEVWQQAQKDLESGNVIRRRLDELRKAIGDLDRQLQENPKDQALKDSRQELAEKIQGLEEELKPLDRYRTPERSAGCSTATPVSDGRHVFAVFGTGVVVCYDLAGEQQWVRLFDKPKLDWGHTASPLLTSGRLLIHLDDLVALDPQSGETLWSAEVKANYGSPVPCRAGDTDLVATAGGDVIRVSDGKILAKGVVEQLRACSPIANGSTLYFIQGQARAVRLPSDLAAGGEPQTVWEKKLYQDNYYASPLLHKGLIYAVSENRVLTVLDAETGEEVYEQKLRFKGRGAVTSSLAAVGDQVYIIQENGNTKVLRAGREYEELAENPLEGLRSSPVVADGRLYIRGNEHLYCIGD
ncbi:MAG: PQQ-binding-like beta-propeller repeat protein [Pirellulales bacterium]